EFAGRIIESWLPVVYDTERELPLHRADDSRKIVRVNTEHPYKDHETGTAVQYVVGQGEHDITISTGPSYNTQRDAADDFIERLVGNMEALPIMPEVKAKLLSLAVRMKNLGPLGDEMADLIDPNDKGELSPQAKAQIQAGQQKLMAMNAYAQQLEEELKKLQLE